MVAGLGAADFPVSSTAIEELGQVASDAQFELGLLALVQGLPAAR